MLHESPTSIQIEHIAGLKIEYQYDETYYIQPSVKYLDQPHILKF